MGSSLKKDFPRGRSFMSFAGLAGRFGVEAGRGFTTALAVLAATWGASPSVCPPCAPTLECHSGSSTLRQETTSFAAALLAALLFFSCGLLAGAGLFWYLVSRAAGEKGKKGGGRGVWL